MNNTSPKLAILCLEDEPAVLDAVVRDLAPFEDVFLIEPVESVADAREVLADLTERGIPLALALCDHLLPNVTGTEFLIELNQSEATRNARKVLITAQAGLSDTVRAVNDGNLNHYIAKPWKPDELRAVVREQLTTYVIQTKTNPLPYVSTLDGVRLMEVMGAGSLTDQ